MSSCSNGRLTMEGSKNALKWDGALTSLFELIADNLIEKMSAAV